MPLVQPAVNWWRRHQPILNEATVAGFHESGYMVMDLGLPTATLDRAIADLMARQDLQTNLHHGARWMDGWKQSKAIRAIARAPRVLRVLRQLYGREPLPFQTLNFPIGTQQRIHSDTIHFDCDPPSYMVGVWVALEAIDDANGPLLFYPYSHKLPKVRMEDVAPGPGPEHYSKYEDYVEKLVADSGLPAHKGLLKKGQALIWAANLYHGGAVQRDKQRTRLSQVTHYYFANCQYYTPMLSYGGYRYLRQPDWIR